MKWSQLRDTILNLGRKTIGNWDVREIFILHFQDMETQAIIKYLTSILWGFGLRVFGT